MTNEASESTVAARILLYQGSREGYQFEIGIASIVFKIGNIYQSVE